MKPDIAKQKEKAIQRAIGLLDALMDDRVWAETKAKIQEWFVSDMSKDAKYDALKKLFVELEPNLNHCRQEYERYVKISTILGFNDGVQPTVKRKSGFSQYAMRVAAVLIPAIAIAGAAYLWIGRAGETAEQYPLANVSVSAAADRQKRIVLPDGSEVWINSSSEISYNDDFSKQRFVSLSGEAYFSVVRDTLVPFRVKADDLMIEVLGTEFSVKARYNAPAAEVTLTSGSVQVTTPKKEKIVLDPNHRLTIDRKSLKVIIDEIRTDTISAWRVCNLRFVDTPLKDALQDISNYYGRDLVLGGWKPTDDLINISLDQELPLDQVMTAIRNITGNFTYEITEKELIIEQAL